MHVIFRAGHVAFIAVVEKFVKVNPCVWSKRECKTTMVPHDAIVVALPFQELEDDLVRVIWPAVL